MKDMINKVFNEDCLETMKRMADKSIDLVLTDPPYGIKINKMNFVTSGAVKVGGAYRNDYSKHNTEWDNFTPSKEYFEELMRVSKNQIVWGGNYMTEFLKPSMGWIIWDKGQRGFSLADGEMAWTSFNKAMRIFEFSRAGCIKSNNTMIEKFHPTAKPFELYKYCLDKYAKQGDKILDTHLGSMSIAIACADYGFDLYGCELDSEYYKKGLERVQNHINQLDIFTERPKIITNI